MEFIVWLIIIFIAIVFSNIKKKKEAEAKAKQHPTTTTFQAPVQNTQRKSFKQLMDELQQQAIEANNLIEKNIQIISEEPLEEPLIKESPKTYFQLKEEKKSNLDNIQLADNITTDSELSYNTEMSESTNYETYVEEARKKHHDANEHHLDKRIASPLLEYEETYPTPEINLKNLIMAEIILKRPNYD